MAKSRKHGQELLRGQLTGGLDDGDKIVGENKLVRAVQTKEELATVSG
jgi:hypothetical protein